MSHAVRFWICCAMATVWLGIVMLEGITWYGMTFIGASLVLACYSAWAAAKEE